MGRLELRCKTARRHSRNSAGSCGKCAPQARYRLPLFRLGQSDVSTTSSAGIGISGPCSPSSAAVLSRPRRSQRWQVTSSIAVRSATWPRRSALSVIAENGPFRTALPPTRGRMQGSKAPHPGENRTFRKIACHQWLLIRLEFLSSRNSVRRPGQNSATTHPHAHQTARSPAAFRVRAGRTRCTARRLRAVLLRVESRFGLGAKRRHVIRRLPT